MVAIVSSEERKKRIKYLMSIKEYQKRVSFLIKGKFDLSNVQEIDEKKKTKKLEVHNNKILVKFSEKNSGFFFLFIENLYQKNKSEILIYAKGSKVCGPYKIKNLRQFNVSFPYDFDPSGIVCLSSKDGHDKLIFDFYEENGEFLLEIEWSGLNWSSVKYENS